MKKPILLLLIIILASPVFASSFASETEWQPVKRESQTLGTNHPGGEIWGQIRVFTGHSVILESGEEYDFSKNVLVDVENLKQNKKGNVRIVLDLDGKADYVFFHGIDMPEMFRRFGR
ncbi:MAG: hypothetical protein GXO96_00590 [Nitrospirae bacterium]|nr:hypothetical protein [Candidatus Manganitrophaceae bacterium]